MTYGKWQMILNVQATILFSLHMIADFTMSLVVGDNLNLQYWQLPKVNINVLFSRLSGKQMF